MPGDILTFPNLSANIAIRQWLRLREMQGKSKADALRRIFKAWVFAAWEMVPPGNKPRIRSFLMQQNRRAAMVKTPNMARRSKAKIASEMRGTVAAAIVWALDWKGARGTRGAQFYRLVKKFLNARLFSANLHRAGMFPAFDLVYGRPAGASGPRYKHQPGAAEEKILTDSAEFLAENWASAKDGDGITGIAGSAFEATIGKVIDKFEAFALKDELDAARKFGFDVRMA